MVEQNENGWAEYRRMVIDWHEQEIKEREHIRESLADYQKQTTAKLDSISAALNRIEHERKTMHYFGGLILPAGVALGVSWLGRKLGF